MREERLVQITIRGERYRFFSSKKFMLSDIKVISENLFSEVKNIQKYIFDNVIYIDYIDFDCEGEEMYEDDIENFYNFPLKEIARIVNSEVKKVKVVANFDLKDRCYLFTNKGKRVA